MLEPIKLLAKGVCQHLNTAIDFQPGITLVQGPNGSGKSNFTHPTLYFAITGEKVPGGATKKEMLNWSRAAGYSEFTFRYDGAVYTLRRNVHNAVVVLKKEGEEILKGEKDQIANFMKTAMGMSPKAFYLSCFAPQGKLAEIIDMTHSERMMYFQQLFGTDQAESMRGSIKKAIDCLPTYPDRTASIQENAQIISDLDIQCTGHTNTIEAWQKSKDEYEAVIDDWRNILQKPSSEVSQARYQRALDADNAAKKAITDYETIHQISPVVEVPAITQEETQQYYGKAQFDAALNSIPALEAAVEATQIHRIAEPTAPSSDDATVEADKAVAAALPEYQLATKGVCPTCTRPFDYAGGEEAKQLAISTYMNAVAVKDAAEAKYRADYAEYTLTRNAHLEAEEVYNEHNNRLVDAKNVMETYRAYEFYDAAVHEAKQAAYEQYTRDVATMNAHQSEIKRLTALQASTNVELVTCTAVLNDTATDAQRLQAQGIVDTYADIGMNIQNAEIAWASTDTDRQSRIAQSKVWREEMDGNAKIRAKKEQLEDARTLLHRDNLQAAVISPALDSLNLLIEQYLNRFNKDYTAWIDDSFDFRVAKSNNPDFPARLLSGGEKIALALAYRMAIAELKGNAIPIMVLDEPTVFLDEDGINGLVDVLKIARTFAEQGLYILVPSHEKILEACKSHIVHMDDIKKK